jgi:AcrR family transcriptional regulator
MGQALEMKQRIPTQLRAKVAVDTLHEATARILEAGDDAPLTSNHIAARAGYTVGTFYDYFPNKQALLRSMALREVTRQVARVNAALADMPADTTGAALVRLVIGAALRPFGNRPRLRQRLVPMVFGDAEVMTAATDLQATIMDQLIAGLTLRGLLDDGSVTPMARQVLASAVFGAIRQGPPGVMSLHEFEGQLVTLICRTLNVREVP